MYIYIYRFFQLTVYLSSQFPDQSKKREKFLHIVSTHFFKSTSQLIFYLHRARTSGISLVYDFQWSEGPTKGTTEDLRNVLGVES